MIIFLLWQRPWVVDRFQSPADGKWVETWLVPAFGYQYVLFSRRCTAKVRTALRYARASGATKVILGGLNKASFIAKGGTEFAAEYEASTMKLDDGNLLTAAVLNDHIQSGEN